MEGKIRKRNDSVEEAKETHEMEWKQGTGRLRLGEGILKKPVQDRAGAGACVTGLVKLSFTGVGDS